MTSDYCLGGVLNIRLIDATPRDVAAVEGQLGPVPRGLEGDPDLTIRFVDRLARPADLCFVGHADAAFTRDSFVLLRGKAKSRVHVEIPIEAIGGPLEIRCERGLDAVPMLVPILNATLVAKGFLPLHAAAFEYEGTGIVATGWSKGGKTETLLAFMSRGARYVADEWLYLAPDGATMFGLPEPVRVWSWHVDSLPELRRHVPLGARARMFALDLATRGMQRATGSGTRRGGLARTLDRVSHLAQRQTCVDIEPASLFRQARNGSRDEERPPARVERILFVLSHAREDISVRPVSSSVVAERMHASLDEEDQRLRSCYNKFRFAFPERRNAFLEDLEERRRELLRAAFQGKPAFEVRHPYPVSLPALFERLTEVCAR